MEKYLSSICFQTVREVFQITETCEKSVELHAFYCESNGNLQSPPGNTEHSSITEHENSAKLNIRKVSASAELRKTTVSFVMHVCPSAWYNSAPARPIFMKSGIWVLFTNLPRKYKFHLIFTRITGTLHADLRIFIITSRLILLRPRNVSDKIFIENQNAHLMFSCREEENVRFISSTLSTVTIKVIWAIKEVVWKRQGCNSMLKFSNLWKL